MIRIFKLITGEEVIANYKESSIPSKICLNKPMILALTENGVTIFPYTMLSKDKEIEIDKHNIMCEYAPLDEIEKNYRERTSGIVTANQVDMTNLG